MVTLVPPDTGPDPGDILSKTGVWNYTILEYKVQKPNKVHNLWNKQPKKYLLLQGIFLFIF